MSSEPKRIPLIFDCPNCSQRANANFTKFELEIAAKHGVIDVYHIVCNHRWTENLNDVMRANIASLIAREF